jgi:hypothetical protein
MLLPGLAGCGPAYQCSVCISKNIGGPLVRRSSICCVMSTSQYTVKGDSHRKILGGGMCSVHDTYLNGRLKISIYLGYVHRINQI